MSRLTLTAASLLAAAAVSSSLMAEEVVIDWSGQSYYQSSYVDLQGYSSSGNFSIRLWGFDFGLGTNAGATQKVDDFFAANDSISGSFSYDTDATFIGFDAYEANSLTVDVTDPDSLSVTEAYASLPTVQIADSFYQEGAQRFGFSSYSAAVFGYSLDDTSVATTIDLSSSPYHSFGDGGLEGLSQSILQKTTELSFFSPDSWAVSFLAANIDISGPDGVLPTEINLANNNDSGTFSIAGITCTSDCGRVEEGDEFIQIENIRFSSSTNFDNIVFTVNSGEEPIEFSDYINPGYENYAEIVQSTLVNGFAYNDGEIVVLADEGANIVFQIAAEAELINYGVFSLGSYGSESSARFVNLGRFENGYDFYNYGEMENRGEFINNSFLVNEGMLTTTEGNDITNEQYSYIDNFGQLVVASGTLENYGYVYNQNQIIVGENGNIDNNGELYNDWLGEIEILGSQQRQLDGDIINNGSIISNEATLIFAGQLSGSGWVDAGIAIIAGGLNPGNSPGLMNFTGDVAFTETSVFDVEILGTTLGTEYDSINVAGELTLDGTLSAGLLDSYTPEAGDVFDIAIAEMILGEFDVLYLPELTGDLIWDLAILTDFNGTLDVLRLSVTSAVPVPAAAWLFGSALLGLMGLKKRRH